METPVPVQEIPVQEAKIDLASVLKKTVAPTMWVEYKEGIFFEFRFMSKSRFRQMAEECTDMKYNSQTKAREPKMDTDRFMKKFLAMAVANWRGVTIDSISRIAEIDLEGYSEKQRKQPMDFSLTELQKLIDMVYELDPFIQSAVTDIRTFRPSLEDELKNSKSSQSGS